MLETYAQNIIEHMLQMGLWMHVCIMEYIGHSMCRAPLYSCSIRFVCRFRGYRVSAVCIKRENTVERGHVTNLSKNSSRIKVAVRQKRRREDHL